MFGIGQCAVQYLDDLRRAELAGVVFDPGPAAARAGLVAVDPEHAHQLALDRLAQDSLAVEHRVLPFDRADALAHNPPASHPLPIAVIADRAVLVAGRQRRWHIHNRVTARSVPKQSRHALEDLALAVLRRIETQLDRRR